MQLLWVMLSLGSALASAVPSSHQLRLPFAPSTDDLENCVRSRLSINLSIQNGSLYANDHQLYPPSVIMQLNAPLYGSADQIDPSDNTVELSYTLDVEPLQNNDMASIADMIRVRVEWFDLQNNLVSPDAVAVDLLAYQSDKYEMTRIRVEPARGSDQDGHLYEKSQPWVINYWRTQFGSVFDKRKTAETTAAPPMESPAQPDAIQVSSNENETRSAPETHFFSFWATPANLHRHAEHRHPHYRHHKNSFMRIIRPIVVPALLGVVAGLVACLVGFFIGQLLASLGVCLGWQRVLGYRSRIVSEEEGTVSEKASMLLHVYVADTAESESNDSV
ncbi:hypothetical protein CBS147330_6279 [Penicillium roqueforti]|nr:hypothetical protein CBS147330_6279 [Penicillium roqueforti]